VRKRLCLRVFYAVLLAWAGSGFAIELYRNAWLYRADPWRADEPSTWRITSQRVADLRALVAPLADDNAPLKVAVIADLASPEERFFLFLWVAYLLPRHEVRPFDEAATWRAYDRVVVYGGRRDNPDLEAFDSLQVGTLYRVRGAGR
jgi:hypothetical protein